MTELRLKAKDANQVMLNNSLSMCSALLDGLELLLVNKLNILQLDSVYLTSSAAEALSRSLQSQHCSLVTLEFYDCSFLSDAFKQLAIGIGRSTSLHDIGFVRSILDSACGKTLTSALKKNRTLKKVALCLSIGNEDTLRQCNPNIVFDFSPYGDI